ncbi:MAG TPA: hypothetical protein PL035_02035 [Bacillota bacterium]|nr:hypothetical protein [Bacillota bacterium]
MTLSELYNALEIDDPRELEYFEQLAELLEMEEHIPYELFAMALSGLSPESAAELAGNYMEELSGGLPEGFDDLFFIIESIQQRLLLHCGNQDEERGLKDFTEELYRFREWYHKEGNASMDGKDCSVMEAAACLRGMRFSGEEKSVDFSGALDYKIEELSVGLGAFRKIDIADSDARERN